MPEATVTSKGQITIPKAIRDKLRLKTGDRLVFRLEADGSARVHAVTKPVTAVAGLLEGRRRRVRRVLDIDAALRRVRARDRW